MAERSQIAPRDAEATARTVSLLGLNTSTARILGLRSTDQLQRAAQGRAQLTAFQLDQLRLANSERSHIESAQVRNRAQRADRRLTDVERDRAILDWLRAGKTPGGKQTPAARRTSIRALAALGYDPAERAIYKRRRGR